MAARVLLKVPDCAEQVSVLFERVTVVSYISSISISSNLWEEWKEDERRSHYNNSQPTYTRTDSSPSIVHDLDQDITSIAPSRILLRDWRSIEYLPLSNLLERETGPPRQILLTIT